VGLNAPDFNQNWRLTGRYSHDNSFTQEPGGLFLNLQVPNVATTATNVPAPTFVPPVGGVPLNANCDFENGWSAWAHNAPTVLQSPGGGTGPTYAVAFSVPQGFGAGFLNGNMWTPFDWPGGHSVDLVVRDVTVGPNATSLWYDVVR